MTDALFLAELDEPVVGDEVTLAGDEGRHAVAVRRIQVGETILLSNGAGVAVRGPVTSVQKAALTLTVAEVLHEEADELRFVAVQALAKGDRGELAVEMLTEFGVDEVVPWQAARSVVKWAPERAERQLAKWRATVREATKQSRRLRVPVVSPLLSTRELTLRIPDTALTLVLHEDAEAPLAKVELPESGDVMLIVGPEGGISPEELDVLVSAGAQAVRINSAVLRTSTAGVVALAQLQLLADLRG